MGLLLRVFVAIVFAPLLAIAAIAALFLRPAPRPTDN